jgi:poly(3-hydroxybutyrate) depolymerase
MKPGRSLIVFAVFALAFHAAKAQETLTPGKITDRVTIEADKTQSYSLYLPSKFDGKTKLPIIYVFDPGARGKTGVEVFADAAEKYGYIVVGSNDSRNGLSGDKLMPIFNNISGDTHRRFAIDDSRIVMAGFSGGARVASIFASLCKCAFAVIGSGAGFWQNIVVDNKLPFVYFGAAGYDDLNYFELRSLSEKLAAAQATYRIAYFDGQHQWLPASLAEQALAWVELQTMRSNHKMKDNAFIERSFLERTAAADAMFSQKKYVEAEAAYRSIIRDFDGIKDTAAIAEKLKSVSTSAEFKKALKAEKDEAADYERTSNEFYRFVQNLGRNESRQETLSRLQSAAQGLRNRSTAAEDSASRRTARRVLDGVYISSVEAASAAVQSGEKIDDAFNFLELADAMRPKNAYVSYLRAQLFAIDGQKSRALDALAKAVDLGLKNRQLIESEKAFEKIRTAPEFQKILSRLNSE